MSKHTPAKKMDPEVLSSIIGFWKSGLQSHRLLMGPSAIYFTDTTIKILEALQSSINDGNTPLNIFSDKV